MNILSVLFQNRNVVLIREPNHRHYSPPADVSETAGDFWEYAEMSNAAYLDIDKRPSAPAGWTRWNSDKIFGEDVTEEARKTGLGFDVLEKESRSGRTLAVVFKGTEFSWKDWRSNLRWLQRFMPYYKDQYTVTASHLSQAIVDELAKSLDTKELRIVSTGHSLGGGLAQHFAYSLPLVSTDGKEVPRVSHVYAFHPSPVTGWSTAGNQRNINVKGLKIDRIFEHGEFLAYFRLLFSYFLPPSAANPGIREIRYSFVPSWNPLRTHSIELLANGLSQYRQPEASSLTPNL